MFNKNSGKSDFNNDAIPQGTVCKGVIHMREIKASGNTGGEYFDLEITVLEGPFAKRKIWEMIMSPSDDRHSEAARRMGLVSITRILETAGVFKHDDESSYERFGPSPATIDLAEAINGREVVFRVKVEKGQDGKQDKNRVLEWGTNSPDSGSGYKLWSEYQKNGPQGKPAAPAPATSTAKPNWLANANAPASSREPF